MTLDTISNRAISRLCEILLTALLCTCSSGAYSQSQQITTAGEYTFGIEGPAVGPDGTLYVANFQKPGTIGKLAPGASKSELFMTLPDGGIANGIRFDRAGRMFIADYKRHNIFVIEQPGADLKLYFHSDDFNQPNDMTIASDGTIYASDPCWKCRNGQIWRITRGSDGNGIGERMTAPRAMSTTNGIDLSPDDQTLYVGESDTREIWSYRVNGAQLEAPRLVMKFKDFGIDGLRVDSGGRLYIARILKNAIAILTPEGKLEREVSLSASEPTNIAFGGPDGRMAYVTQRKGGYIESFITDRPGREFCMQAAACSQPPAKR